MKWHLLMVLIFISFMISSVEHLFRFTSVQFSDWVMSDFLWPHGLQQARLPCQSSCSNSGPSSQWCYPATSSSIIPFCSYLQSFPASGSFQVSRLFAPGGQSIGASASASVLPMSIQGWFPLGWTDLISFLSRGPSGVFSSTTVQKYQFFSAFHSSQFNSHIHTWLMERLQPWPHEPLLAKWCLCFLRHCLGLS